MENRNKRIRRNAETFFERLVDESVSIDDLLLKSLFLYEKTHQDLMKAYNTKLYSEIVYNDEANALRININEIKEELGLSKAPTEKQAQSYIDNKLKNEYNNLLTNKTSVKMIEKQIGCYRTVMTGLFTIASMRDDKE